MRIYTVHLPPPVSGAGRETLVIREGFNFWAFLFGGVWALANRMWLAGIALLALQGALAAAIRYWALTDLGEAVVLIAVAVWIGASANDWRRRHLARKGWKEAAVIAAGDRDAALRRYLDLEAIGRAAA